MSDAREQTPRQRHAAATALNIERHAVALVLEHGFDNVTVDMICEASGVSQRTFFNYFGTKDAAILGANTPRIDERRAREFIASDGKNLLGEALGLINLAPSDVADKQLGAARVRVISENPTLFHKQMERFSAIQAEIEDILYFRLRRTAKVDETPDDTRELAALTAQMLAGIFRFAAIRWVRDDHLSSSNHLDHTAELIAAVLPRLAAE